MAGAWKVHESEYLGTRTFNESGRLGDRGVLIQIPNLRTGSLIHGPCIKYPDEDCMGEAGT
jgi:hypothetical protein